VSTTRLRSEGKEEEMWEIVRTVSLRGIKDVRQEALDVLAFPKRRFMIV